MSVNSHGSVEIVEGEPADEDLKKNEDVRIKVGSNYLSLAEAIMTCKQNSQQWNEDSSTVSSQINQASASPIIRPEQLRAANQ
ncbi:hypothetical protein HET73_05870 [Wolbachia endosymbiont of Atemnus politus]|uniref:hypothetical protein n=1 Tax=Wolbachia endosymbiont of Atemnus politus TaxID=2682840 RepID=UPI001571A5DE|nr:hypothetical protein [Wolbachia endosymbiont of Atemnus politus]NSM56883.1 hypothetical protein [Wolbachia endosymbiont of Atemnus politus]NSX83663.1 hypothetical protein [Wolbachia endosymbiont of Atemnus politus]